MLAFRFSQQVEIGLISLNTVENLEAFGKYMPSTT